VGYGATEPNEVYFGALKRVESDKIRAEKSRKEISPPLATFTQPQAGPRRGERRGREKRFRLGVGMGCAHLRALLATVDKPPEEEFSHSLPSRRHGVHGGTEGSQKIKIKIKIRNRNMNRNGLRRQRPKRRETATEPVALQNPFLIFSDMDPGLWPPPSAFTPSPLRLLSPGLFNKPSATNHQPSTTNHQPSTIN